MKVREKLKRANRQLENQEKMIAGLQRGTRYLHGVCENMRKEAAEQKAEQEQRQEVMLLLLAGCALAAGGEITIQTENMQRALQERRVVFGADFNAHTATIKITEVAVEAFGYDE